VVRVKVVVSPICNEVFPALREILVMIGEVVVIVVVVVGVAVGVVVALGAVGLEPPPQAQVPAITIIPISRRTG
jgi:hypothetical protein